MSPVSPVRTPAELEEFIRLPWSLYKGDKNWIPPLLDAERKLINPERRNPFWLHGQAEYFVAKRDGRVVGRIGAITNYLHNQVHEDKVGFFGFFECERDTGTAQDLFAAAEAWLRGKGMTTARGPVNPSMNDPCGLLVDGFKWPPFVLMTYNPPWYAELLESAEYTKVMDLYAYIILTTDVIREKIDRVANAVKDRGRVTIRTVDMSRFEAELACVMSIYNDAWEKNWGFVPMTAEEIRFVAADFRAILLPEWVYFATVDGEDVGFSLALPDINHALKRANGRLFPFGWFYFLKRNIRKIPAIRLVALGVKRKFQHLGIGTLFYQRYIEEGIKRGYKAAELSWVLETNEPMNRPIRELGAKPYKTYRLFERALARNTTYEQRRRLAKSEDVVEPKPGLPPELPPTVEHGA
jgi:GNAT superfamily N-acetyltransferase